MATINHRIKVTEEGLTEIEQKGKRVNKQLTDGERNARAMGKALNSTVSPTLSKGKGEDRQDYRVARAGAGTGAAGRDFAKQAQGLGGLVHVYATFAANIFAVTAAFTALDMAYSTIRLEAAADIMSNKLGFSIKNLSKDLIEATGHSISFQEALQFSAMGTAAGLTGKQITNLTVIAKGAANALGRDMGDAVRRIVQGTAKQEQEILDELGIFVRAKTAYAEYAKKIGADNADALTAQQRVQAYAEAVALAGEKWRDYAKIEDPFSKLTASLKESGTELLNILNSVLTPVIKVLVESEGLIKGILLLVTAKLGGMALPHIGEKLGSMFTVPESEIAAFEENKQRIISGFSKDLDRFKAEKASLEQERGGMQKDAFKDRLGPKGGVVKTLKADIAGADKSNLLSLEKAIEASLQRQLDTNKKSAQLLKDHGLLTSKGALKQSEITKLAKEALATEQLKLQIKQQELGISEKISILQGEVVARGEEVHKGMVGGKIFGYVWDPKSKQNLENQKRHIDGVNDSITSSGLNLSARLSGIYSGITGIYTGTEGKLAKIGAAFKVLGTTISVALRGIFAVMGPIMALMSAWELALKPALYFIGVFSEKQDKLVESYARLKEGSDVAVGSLERVNKALKEGGSLNDILELYDNRAKALTAIREGLAKTLEETTTTRKQEEKKPKLIGGSTIKYLGLTEPVLASKDFLRNVSPTLKGYTDLEEAINSFQTAEALFQKNINDTSRIERRETAWQKVLRVMQLIETEEQKRKKPLEDIRDAGKDALAQWAELDKKYKERLNLTRGMESQEGQTAFNAQERMVDKISLVEEPNKDTARIGVLTLTKTLTEDLGLSAEDTSNRLTLMWAALSGAEADPTKLNEVKLIFEKLNILKEEKSGALKDIREQRILDAAREELKTLNNVAKIEEKRLGYITDTLSKKTYLKELAIADREYEKESIKVNTEGKGVLALKLKNKNEELRITHEQLIEQQALNKLKFEEIEPAQRALNIAKAEYDFKKKTTGTNALDDLKAEEAARQASFNLKIQQLGELNTKDKQNAADNIKNESRISTLASQSAIFELQKKERQDATTLGLELYLARQDELIKGKDKLAAYDKLGLTFAELKKAQITEELDRINKIESVELKLLNLAKLKVSVEKDISDQKKLQHEADKRALSDALGTKDYEDVLAKVGGWSTIAFNEAHKRTEEFKDSMRTVIEGAFDGLYSGMDSAIDNLTAKWMKSQKFSLKEIVLDFKNAAAEEFRKMAADQMKLSARKAIEGISLAVFGIPKESDKPQLMVNHLKNIDENIKKLTDLSSPSSRGISAADDMKATEQGFYKDIAGTGTKAIGSSIGGNGLVGKIITKGLDLGVNYFTKMFGFANGGVMSQYGAMKLNTYASGGVASSPQLAIFGEGRQNEAYVPLPDGKTIPVTMNMPASGGQGTGPISIQVVVNTTTGQADTKTTGAGPKIDAMAEFGKIISQKVKEEIINQSRPGGLLRN